MKLKLHSTPAAPKTGDCYKVVSYNYMNMYILFTYESITINVIKDIPLFLVGFVRTLCIAIVIYL